jgi:hypothetical protein
MSTNIPSGLVMHAFVLPHAEAMQEPAWSCKVRSLQV